MGMGSAAGSDGGSAGGKAPCPCAKRSSWLVSRRFFTRPALDLEVRFTAGRIGSNPVGHCQCPPQLNLSSTPVPPQLTAPHPGLSQSFSLDQRRRVWLPLT